MGQPGFLFTPTVPEGFHYRADFLTAAEEDHLAAALERIPFADFEMRGVVARRRVAFFGHSYGHDVMPRRFPNSCCPCGRPSRCGQASNPAPT